MSLKLTTLKNNSPDRLQEAYIKAKLSLNNLAFMLVY